MENLNFANRHGYTDIYPYEIVRRVSDKTIEIRQMDSERDPSWKPIMIPGGFAAHTVNQHEQRWIITPNGDNKVIRIRRNKRGWQDKHGHRYILSDKPRRFYDYNF